MPVPGFLGFHGLLVVVLLVFYSLIRQKCKNAVARKEEVTKLMAVAAEESLMEEFQAANQHSFLPSSPPRLYQCAVCFRSTTTRCSRCKAVRYWLVSRLALLHFESKSNFFFKIIYVSALKFEVWKFLK